MIEPGNVSHVLDVVGDVGDRRPRHRVVADPVVELRPAGEVPVVQPAPLRLGGGGSLPLPARRRDEPGHERGHRDPAVARQPPEYLVRDIPRMIGHGPGRGVREDHRNRRDVEDIAHRVRRHVRQVDEHADPLHLGHDLAAEVRQPAVRGVVGRRVSPRHVAVVGQRHVPDAQRVHRPEYSERAPDRVPALRADQRRHLAGRHDPLNVRGGQRELERVPVPADQAVHEIDLLQGGRDRCLSLQLGRNIDRPELGSHSAGGQPGQVGLRERNRGGDVHQRRITAACLPQCPREVVVTIDDRSRGKQIAGGTEAGWRGGR